MKILPQNEEELKERISEARQLSVAAPIIFPLLEKRKHAAFQRLMGSHRDGKQPDANAISEMFVIDSIQAEIRARLDFLNLKED